jgi:hypothetical protein
MAGKAQTVKHIILAAAMLCAPAALGAAGGLGDILIVAHPERLTVYNTYQQRLSREEGQALAAFEPMVIVREKDVLGDGFTPCMSVRVNGGVYFLQTGPDGRPLENGGTAGITTLRGVKVLGDTIVVRKPGGFTVRSFENRSTAEAPSGTLLVREFLREGETYIRFPSTPPQFGWATLGAGEWARRRVAKEATADVFAPLLPSLRRLVNDANAALRNMYARFHGESAAVSAPPHFLLDERGDSLLCTLSPPARARAFRESIAALARSFEGLFSEGDVRVEVAGNRIIVVQL